MFISIRTEFLIDFTLHQWLYLTMCIKCAICWSVWVETAKKYQKTLTNSFVISCHWLCSDWLSSERHTYMHKFVYIISYIVCFCRIEPLFVACHLIHSTFCSRKCVKLTKLARWVYACAVFMYYNYSYYMACALQRLIAALKKKICDVYIYICDMYINICSRIQIVFEAKKKVLINANLFI